MPNALVEINGKQFSVKLGGEIVVDNLNKEIGDKVNFAKVLLLEVDGKTTVGQPYIEGVIVEAEVVGNVRGPKIYVKKFKSKVRYRRKHGFKSKQTSLKIIKIGEHRHLTKVVKKPTEETKVKVKSVKKTAKVKKETAKK